MYEKKPAQIPNYRNDRRPTILYCLSAFFRYNEDIMV
jgi:hypothetical protein